MSLISKSIGMAGAVLALAVAGTAQAGSIVVRATGTKAYPVGTKLADNAKVTLKSGESVTILDGKGTRQLNGPGTFTTVIGGGAAQEARVNNVIRNSGTRVARTGAIRGTGPVARPSSIWQADFLRGGTICVANPASFSAWRPDTSKPATYTATRTSDGKSGQIIFGPARAHTLWPAAELPVDGASTYRITGDGIVNPVIVRFVPMNASPTGLESTISEMMGKGCTSQYELLIDLVNVVDDANPTAG